MSVGSSRATVGRAGFELDSFELLEGARWEVRGRWSGVRGRRFIRPALIFELDGQERRVLADMAGKPWQAEDGKDWRVVFPRHREPEELVAPRLAVGPDVMVSLGGHGAASRSSASRPKAPRRTVAQLDAQLKGLRAELDGVRAELEQARRFAAAADRERDEAILARDAGAAARDSAVAARDSAVAARDSAVAAREEALAAREEALAARDAARAELEAVRAASQASVPGQAPVQAPAPVAEPDPFPEIGRPRALAEFAAPEPQRHEEARATSASARVGAVAMLVIVAIVLILIISHA